MAKTKIKENPDLVKDTNTGAVINTNSNAFFFFSSDFKNVSTLFPAINEICIWLFKV